jgi:hypothetical protein
MKIIGYFNLLIACIGTAVCVNAQENRKNIELQTSSNAKGTKVFVNNKTCYSLVGNSNKQNITYAQCSIPVKPVSLKGKALVFQAWSNTPQNTMAFYIRGMNAKGECVASWQSWNNTINKNPKNIILIQGENYSGLKWEPYMIKGVLDSPIVKFVVFIGTRKKNCKFDVLITAPIVKKEVSAIIKTNKENFKILGVGASIAQVRNLVSTVDKKGHRLIVCDAQDSGIRGYLLVTDIDQNKTWQYFNPNRIRQRDSFGAVLASNGNFYYAQGNHVLGFDINSRKWKDLGTPDLGTNYYITFIEDYKGVIWGGGTPNTNLISYNPANGEFKNHGRMDPREKYLSWLACDRKGWIYVGIGTAKANIIAYNPETGEKRQLLPESDRKIGSVRVYNGIDGIAYGQYKGKFFKLDDGKAVLTTQEHAALPQKNGALKYGSRKTDFPDGSKVTLYDLYSKTAEISIPNSLEKSKIIINYIPAGASLTSLGSGPDKTVYASSSHPMHFIKVNSNNGDIHDFGPIPIVGGGNFCAITSSSKKVYACEYAGGRMWEYDPMKKWDIAKKQHYAFSLPLDELIKSSQANNGYFSYINSLKILFFKGDKSGATGTILPKLKESGEYYLNLIFYEYAQYGTVSIKLNGKRLGTFNCQNSNGGAGKLISLGPFNLKTGKQEIMFSVEANKDSNPWFSLCALSLNHQKLKLNSVKIPEPNPRIIGAWPTKITRPRTIILHPDNKRVIMAGFPGYGHVGGGIGIHNLENKKNHIISLEGPLKGHSCIALDILADGNLVGGTSIGAPGGGHRLAKEAKIFILNPDSGEVIFSTVPVTGETNISSIAVVKEKVFGITRSGIFFTFDSVLKKIIDIQDLSNFGNSPRKSLIKVDDNRLFVLMTYGILKVDLKTSKTSLIYKPPVSITAGGSSVGDKIYFCSNTKICEYKIPNANKITDKE